MPERFHETSDVCWVRREWNEHWESTSCWQIVDKLLTFFVVLFSAASIDWAGFVHSLELLFFSRISFFMPVSNSMVRIVEWEWPWSNVVCSSFLTSMRRQSVVRISPCLGWSVSPSVGFSYPVRYPLRHVGAGIHFRRDAAPVMPLTWLFCAFCSCRTAADARSFRWSEDQKGEIEYKHLRF